VLVVLVVLAGLTIRTGSALSLLLSWCVWVREECCECVSNSEQWAWACEEEE